MPEDTKGEITVFAKTNFRNKEVPFGIKRDDRRRHMYVLGKTGMGKTTLMESMAIQDIRNGHGMAFLDPHGDSVQRILDCVPNSRINDVVYFNPADMEYPIAFNILESVETKYKHLVASGLMGVFTKIWANLWSARMEYILNNTILALLDSPGNTLLGITRMYVDKKYRKKIVDNIKDPMVRAFWVDEFANYNEKYRTEAIAPIQNKVGQFLSSGIIRNIVGQPKSTIDLRDIMDNRKILIMDLSKGKVGEDNSALLGAMIVTKLQLAAMSRTDIPEQERKDFYLYVDEFQNFATESFATILSEARKYRLNLIVGHQYIAQLEQDKSTKVRDAIFGNVGTMVVFRVGAADAEFLETEFDPIFTPNDLVNLPKYNIILKLMINGVASEPFSATTVPYSQDWVSHNAEKVIKVSRERYANPVAEVEDKISRWMGAEFHQESAVMIGSEDEESVSGTAERMQQEINTDKQIIIESPQIVGQNVFAAAVPLAQGNSSNPPREAYEPPKPAVEHQQLKSPVMSFDLTSLASGGGKPAGNDGRLAPQAGFVARQQEPLQALQPKRMDGGNLGHRNDRPRQQSQDHGRNGQGYRHDSVQDHGQRQGDAARTNGRNSMRSGRNGSHNDFQGRNGHGRDHSKPKSQPQKRDNPIWDTVASLRNEKVLEQGEKISQVLKETPGEPKKAVQAAELKPELVFSEADSINGAHGAPSANVPITGSTADSAPSQLEHLKEEIKAENFSFQEPHAHPNRQNVPPPPLAPRKVLKPGQSSKSS